MAEKSKLFIFNDGTSLRDVIFIPLFLSLFLVYHFFQDVEFQLEMFEGRSISIATAEGLDISKRVRSFYNGIITFILLAASFSYAVQRFRKAISGQDLRMLNAVSAAGTALLFFQLFGATMLPSIHLIIALMLVITGGIILKLKLKFHNEEKVYSSLLIWICTLSFSLYFLQIQLFQLAGLSATQSLPIFILVFSSVLLLFYFIAQRTEPMTYATVQGNIFISFPLAFLPILSVLANEFYMVLNQHSIHSIGIKSIFGTFLLLILFWMFMRRINWRRQNISEYTESLSLLSKSWFPAIVIGISSLAGYKATVSPSVDWFEDANRILPLQQWFDFGKVPFLDTFSSHAFSDFGPGVLFSFLNGYNPLGGFVYQFMIPVIVSLVVYYLLLRVTENGFIALFIALLYPYVDFILPSYYNLIPVTALALLNLYRKQSVLNYFTFFLVLVLMIFWRIDLGSANLVAGLGGILFLCFAVPGFKPDYLQLGKGFFMLSFILLGSLFVTFLFYDGSLFHRFSEILGYISSFQSYGIKELSINKDFKYYSLYFIMPVAVLLSAAYAFIRLVRNHEEKKYVTQISLLILFLSVFYFANFQRGLVRHTLAEYWDTALSSYGFFILSISIFLNERFHKNSTIKFFAFITLASLLIINYKFSSPDLRQNNTYFKAKQQASQALFLSPLNGKINRSPEAPDVAERYNELDAFLRENFSDTSTFLDFSNTPMLYHYLHRITPNYFCQIPHTAHNEQMQEDLLEGLSNYDIPVVVFSNVPMNFWDFLDGIPNTLRHYRISEYIYKNYKPYGILDMHSVWIKKDIDLKISEPSEIVNIKNLDVVKVEGAGITDSIILASTSETPVKIKNILAAPLALKESMHYYLHLKMQSGSAGVLSALVTFGNQQGNETRKVDLRLNSGDSEPFIILDRKPGEEYIQNIDILLPSNSTYSVSSITLNECETIPDLYSKQFQEHTLKLIPYVWGNYDVLSKQSNTESSIKVLDQKYSLQANRETRLLIPPVADVSSGNYIHIKAKAEGEAPAEVVLNYGLGNLRAGAYTFTILPEEYKNYKIRISTQYNWYNSQQEWLTLYSGGATIELESISIEKGD